MQLFYAILLFLIPNVALFAQGKIEVEKRIKASKVPLNTISSIQNTVKTSNIRWFYEKSEKTHTYEAKFSQHTLKYSVEFDSSGILEDIEIFVPQKNIPDSILHQIHLAISPLFDKFRIQKIQYQYRNIEILTAAYKQVAELPPCILFEIIIKAKKEGNWGFYELQINPNGTIDRIQTIIRRNTDHLEF